MRHDKYAVFQVTNNQGFSRLICVRGASFADAAHFEAETGRCCESWLHVSFLGRFDQVESAVDLTEAFELLAQGSTPLLTTDRSTDHRLAVNR